MNVRITHTSGSGDELAVNVTTVRAEDLPPWVGHTLAAGASQITVEYEAEGRLVQYAAADNV